MRKLSMIALAMILIAGCNPPVTSPTPQATSTPKPSATPTPNISPSPSITPSASVMPTSSPSVIPSAEPTVTPTPEPSQNPYKNKMNKVSLGIENAFINVTDRITTDYQKEDREVSEDVINVEPSFIVIDLNQEVVDPKFEADSNFYNWQVYDDLLGKFKDQNIEVFFKLNFDTALNEQSSPRLSKFTTFLGKAADRYRDYKPTWIIGEKINDPNVVSAKPTEYVNFLQVSYNEIKRVTPDAQVYLGSISQSEVFGQNNFYTLDNLLSYINLGITNYCDGFIFEVYSLDVENTDPKSSSPFRYTNYKLIGSYYDYITDFLNKRNILNKKLMLVTDTYGGDLIDGTTQTEQQQANDLLRRVVYGTAKGFDRVYIPDYIDKSINSTANFYKRLGLTRRDNGTSERKLSYWTYKFISDKLKDATFKGNISGLPSNIEGFIFEKDGKTLYIVWNNDNTFTGNVPVVTKNKQGNLIISPSNDSRLGTSLSYDLNVSGSSSVNVSFINNNMNPRIIEEAN